MKLYIINHSFAYELENLTRAFFPNEKIQTVTGGDLPEEPFVYTEVSDEQVYKSHSTYSPIAMLHNTARRGKV